MGTSFLIGLPRTQIERLQGIQNSAARVITLSKKSSHITPILQELHWLPVSCRIVYKLLLFVFKSLNDSAPAYIDDLLKPYTLKTPGSDLTRKRVRGGQTHFGVRPTWNPGQTDPESRSDWPGIQVRLTRNPGQTDPESESERHFGLRFR